jgi:photosystem II stability/assembly factor-like uncharacterized protein
MRRDLWYIAFLLFLVSPTLGQWKKILSVPTGHTHSIYFIDLPGPPRIGFASIWAELFRTEDGGATWTKVATNLGDVSDFTFKDSLTGWCTIRYNPKAILVTHDGGKSWFTELPHNTFGGCEGIFYNSKSQRLFLATWYFGFYYSIDLGKTWTQIGNDKRGYSGIDFSDDSLGIVSAVNLNNPFLRTTDYGITWLPISFSQECWQPLAISKTSTFFAPCEGDGNGLNRSDDGGNTWRWLRTDNLGHLTGVIKGDLCRLYIQRWQGLSTGGEIAGMFRSLDEGMTWEHIGGPWNLYDQRFYVKGRHIYAGDTLGNVWHLYDTVGTATSSSLELGLDQVAFDSISPCSHPRIPVIVKNPHRCDIITIRSISLSAPFTATSFSLPHDVLPGISDTIWIEYAGASTGPASASLKITTQHENFIRDTLIPVNGVRLGSGKSRVTASATSVIFPQTTICSSPLDTTITLHNRGCDTLQIVQVPISLPAGYELLTSVNLPFELLPDSVLTLRFRFTPNSTGTFVAYAGFRIQLPGNTQDLELYFEAKVIAGEGDLAIYPPSFDIPFLSLCNIDSVSGYYTNTGCDSLTIENVSLSGDTDFSGQFKNGQVLAPGDTIWYTVAVEPGSKGIRSGVILIRTKSRTGILHDTTILIQANVIDGSRILSYSFNSINFGSTTLCEEKDSTILLTNSGCDTLVISDTTILGAGFMVSGIEFPFVLLPDESREVSIHTVLDTSGSKTSNSGTLTFISNADNPISPVTLSRSIELPKNYAVGLLMVDGDGTAGEFVKLQLVAGNWWQADNVMRGVSKMDFDLVMNNDLLDYVSTSGTNNVAVNGTHVTVGGNPEIGAQGGVLAEFLYQVHLTNDTMTDIVLSNLTLNNGDSTPCKPTILDSSNGGFTYRYVCGDRAIQTFLRTGKAIDITSIRPNPARDEVTVEIVAEGAVTIEVFDALGKLVQTLDAGRMPALRTLVVPVDKLSSGSYVMRVSSGGSVVSRGFVVER